MILAFFGFLLLAALTVVIIDQVNVAHTSGEPDLPAYLLNRLVRRLPADRREWGAAMSAELTQIQPAGSRWLFTVGAARVVLFPPPRRPLVPLTVAVAGGIGTTVAALTVHAYAPTAQLFVIATGLLLSGYLAVLAARPLTPAGRLGTGIGAAMLLAVAGCVATILYAVIRYPAAGEDPARLFNMLLTIIVVGYAMLAARIRHANASVLRWTVVAVGFGAVPAVADSLGTNGMSGISLLGADTVVLVVAILAAAVTGSWRAGGLVGLWAGLLGALLLFMLGMWGTLRTHADVGDDLGGLIIMLLWFPVGAAALGLLGGALGGKFHTRLANR